MPQPNEANVSRFSTHIHATVRFRQVRPPFQIVGRFDKYRYINFAMYLDTI
jgi:hypothetical protein